MCSALLAYFNEVLPNLGCITAAIVMHKFMLTGIIRAPMDFFDSTPTGRVLARFSKDVEVLDSELPEIFLGIIYCFFEVTRVVI